MASNAVSSTLPSRDYHCKVCDLYLDTVDSLEVHLQYHKENLYVKWGSQTPQNDTENNNCSKVVSDNTTVSAAADSSDAMITKPSPEFQQRATPETSGQFPHPATPQSYHSAPSPYQNSDQTNFSPGTQYNNSYTHNTYSQNQHSDQINWEPSQYNQEYLKHNRFHPYNVQDRISQVSSSSPLYSQPLNQPTPSPSPNQCDKCGFVCDSAVQLTEHCNSSHGGTSSSVPSSSLAFQQFSNKQYNSTFQNENKIKEEQEESSDILDLDSQKVVYPGNEADAHSNYDQSSTSNREVSARPAIMMPWDAQKLYNSNTHLNGDVTLYKEQKIFTDSKNYSVESKICHSEHKFPYSQEKFLSIHHDQKHFMHDEQKIFSGVPVPSHADCTGLSSSANADMKPPYRPYDSSSAPQISSTQPANPTSSMPSIGGKGANWKSNEARRPKTYNCTACNKWFTSSGHLKRHYNTTLHKNAVRSSGQPDPATLPISNHHHPSRDSLRNHQNSVDANNQSPVTSDESRNIDDNALQSPYGNQNFDRSHRVSSIPTKTAYLQQGNVDNSFTNNVITNPLQHAVGSHSLNITNQQSSLVNTNHQGPKNTPLHASGNPPNGEAGPSVSQSHHMRGLLEVTTNNATPVLTQNTQTLTSHTLPPFSHLGVNPYNPRSTDPLGPTVPEATPLYLGQNFQQTITQSYPNGMAPHVTVSASNNQPMVSQVTFGECIPEEVEMETETSSQNELGRLPSFMQLQAQRFGVFLSNYTSVTSPNVGGQILADDATAGYIIVNPVQYSNNSESGEPSVEYDFTFTTCNKNMRESFITYNAESIKIYPYAFAVEGRSIKREEEEEVCTTSSELQILKIEDIMDYANKENYGSQMKSPASPESAKAENENRESPLITSTVPCTPLIERKQLKKSTATTVHKCYECDKLFNKACYLTQHNKTFHSGAKPFKCERCGKRFSDGASYEGHYVKHADNKPFKCDECPKSFNHKTDLRRHMCLHSGCKPFACNHCGKGFIRKDHMVKHFDTHNKKKRITSTTSI